MGKLINGVWVDWIENVKILQKALVIRDDGLILALKRPENAYSRANCWDLPGGSVEEDQIQQWKQGSGKGDLDDILVKSIAVEISQETGLKTSDIRAIHSASAFNDKKQVFTVAIGYQCQTHGYQEIKLSDEHSEFKWVSKDDFFNLEVGDDGGLIKSILSKIVV